MSPALVDAFLLKEDRWFYWHPGVNPVALARAAVRTYGGGGRQGGSTITMQLAQAARRPPHAHAARQAAPDRRRAVARAALLEARAARGLPQRRAVRRQHRGRRRREPAVLRQVAGPRDARRSADARGDSAAPGQPRRPLGLGGRPGRRARPARRPLEPRAARPRGGAAPARSAGDRGAAGRDADGRRRTSSTPCSRIRRIAGACRPRSTRRCSGWSKRQIDRYLTQYGPKGIRNASVLLVDARDMSVKAWVGSADYGTPPSTVRSTACSPSDRPGRR